MPIWCVHVRRCVCLYVHALKGAFVSVYLSVCLSGLSP